MLKKTITLQQTPAKQTKFSDELSIYVPEFTCVEGINKGAMVFPSDNVWRFWDA